MKISETFNWKRITPDNGHYFFGYYDRNPWNPSQTLHLAMKIPQMNRLPQPGELAEIGTVTVDGGYVPLTTTRAWCHQQGCMELFLKHTKNDTFIYNDFDLKDKKLVANIFEIGKGVIGRYERPIYAMSPDGHWGVSLNFGRIPRRGYSYADAPIPLTQPIPDLDDDGLFLIDLYTGESKLLVSYRQMFDIHPVPYGLDDVGKLDPAGHEPAVQEYVGVGYLVHFLSSRMP